MDKSLMLNKIKRELKLKTDKSFAEYLEIKPTSLSMWHKRNTFDNELLYTKCDFLNPHWLLTGQGDMLLKDQGNLAGVTEPPTAYQQEATAIEDIIANKVVERLQPILDTFGAMDAYMAQKELDKAIAEDKEED
jgi:hypothetical protein